MVLERVQCPLWAIKPINQRKHGFFLFVLWLVVPPIYIFSSVASVNRGSKNHMLLVVKEIPECGFDIPPFFLFSKWFNTWILYLFFSIYLFHSVHSSYNSSGIMCKVFSIQPAAH